MMRTLVLFLLLFSFKLGSAQMLDSLSLDTMKGYTSIDEAKLNPDKVVKLVLIKKKLTEAGAEVELK